MELKTIMSFKSNCQIVGEPNENILFLLASLDNFPIKDVFPVPVKP